MNLGEFRLLTAMLPDDYEIVTSPGDATWYEVSADGRDIEAPVAGAPGLVILSDGQEITEEYLIPIRRDLDEDVLMEFRNVPADWEIQSDVFGWVKASTFVGAYEPDDEVLARPGEAYWKGKRG